jgi:CubicO group peptidase (beta-lactamase class C family)
VFSVLICFAARGLFTARTFNGFPTDYGYLWWLMPVRQGAETMITASGHLNQWLFIVPSDDLVVVVMASSIFPNPPEFMIREILPSVIRD